MIKNTHVDLHIPEFLFQELWEIANKKNLFWKDLYLRIFMELLSDNYSGPSPK